jgi:hypothetical protein
MAETYTHLKIMNAALAMIGAGAIGAEDEDSDLANQVVTIYYPRIDALLGMYEWSFSAKTYKLDEVAKTSDNDYDVAEDKFQTGWRHAFKLPGTALGGPRCVLTDPRMPNLPLREFMVEQNIIYADRCPLWATVTVRSDPQVWKPDFRVAATKVVAAEFCVPVTHDSNLAAILREEAEGDPQRDNGRGGLLGRALGADAATSLNQRPNWTDELTSAHLR